ncbi:MAG: NAD-dependent epimerase/dehydratase family protein, partial [Anaerolineae bacterium]|nr:NAD-dependent epimerase/dehydratase family protein [Anaerolineae bacterium]
MPNWLTSNDVSFPDYPFEDVQDLVHDVPLEELRDSSVLVTGATGFIGSHLTHALGSLGVRPSLFVLDYERQVFPSGSSIYHGNLADLHDC